MKTHQRDLARHLRQSEGLSINAIANRVGVAKSSVARWVRDVELSDAQRSALREQAYVGSSKGRTITAALRRDARLRAQAEGRALARKGDPLHVAGCMLYWAEGEKDRNAVRFTNSDPEMVTLFVAFLRKYFELRDDDFRVTCNLFADHVERQQEIERFWLHATGLPPACLYRSKVNVYSKYSKKKRSNRLPYGTVRVTVARTRVSQSIYGSIQEYAGIDRPEWLEGRPSGRRRRCRTRATRNGTAES